MMWKVYDKTGSIERCAIKKLEYNGTWMGECFVSATINSPTPIDFAIGDYLEYRDERFEINYDPSALKKSAVRTSGDSFVYDNVKFNSLSDELTRCDFLDYVKNDNNIHFTALPKFSFYASSIQDLADRIQVNLDRIYTGEKKWTVNVHPEYVSTTNVNISADNIKVWDALGFVNTKFKANFIIRGRIITIGTAGLPVENVFMYGKGNGLYEIQKTAEADQQIITRLRAYGSTRNLPNGYYNKLTGGNGAYLPNNMAVNNLMLPGFPETTLDPYLDSGNVNELGVREGSVFFDGSEDGLPEIYPSMEGMTAEDLEEAGIPVDSTGYLDEVVSAEQISDNGIPNEEGKIEKGTFTITLKDIGFDINDYLTSDTATISMKDGMCGGREFEIVKAEKLGGNNLLTCNRLKDESLNLYFPYKEYNIQSGDKFVLLGIDMPDVYIKAASQRLLDAAKEYLSKNDYVRYSYEPKVDDIYMARQHDQSQTTGEKSIHDTIKEGDIFLFNDDDLGIDGSITIDSLTIKEGDEMIPKYEIVLREEKVVGTLQKIQNQIDSIVGGQGTGGYNSQQILALIKAYGNKLFLSKIYNDVAQGEILFDDRIGSYKFLDGWDGKGWDIEDGNAQFNEGRFRDNALFKKRAGSHTFVSGFPNGFGWDIAPYKRVNAAGVEETKYRLEIDDINVRGKLRAYEFVISQLRGENDNVIFAGMMKVEYLDAGNNKIYLDTDKGVLYNPFRQGDILMVQHFGGMPSAGNNYNVIKQYELQVVDAGIGDTSEGENRLDWITFKNFVGETEDIAQGDVLTRVDSVADSTRKGIVKITTIDEIGAPYMDVVYGMKTDPENATKARVGNLSGIRTKSGVDLTGVWGIYGNGAYFENSTYILDTGNTIEQEFSVMNGKFESAIEGIKNDMSLEAGNILRNSSFADNLNYWETEGEVHFLRVNGSFVYSDGFFSEKITVSDIFQDGNRNVLRLRNASITQKNEVMNIPNRDGELPEEGGEPYSIALFCKAITKGTLKAGIDGTEVLVYQGLLPGETYEKIVKLGDWDRQGDFILSFTGECYIYGVSFFNDDLAALEIRLQTQIIQTQEEIKLLAKKEYVDSELGRVDEEIAEANRQINAAKESVTGVQDSVDGLKNFTDQAFSDGIIDFSEAAAIEKYINTVNETKKSAEATYNKLYANAYLTGQAKTDLLNAKITFFGSVETLLKAINTAIADKKTTDAEKKAVDTAFAAFNDAYASFMAAIEAANKAIQDHLKQFSDDALKEAQNAKEDAAAAQEAADNAKGSVDGLKNFTDTAFADGIISRSEATAIEKYINTVNETKKAVDGTYAELYSNPYLPSSERTFLKNAYDSLDTTIDGLISAINTAIADKKTTTEEKAKVDKAYTAFNTSYNAFTSAVEKANKAIQDYLKNYTDDETGAVRTEFEAEISVMAEQINLRVTREDFDTETGALESRLESKIKIESDKISSVVEDVDYINNKIETAGWITTSEGNQLFARKDNIISTINQTPESVSINASKINLNGAVTFSSFSSSLQSQINGIESDAESALSKANSALSDASDAWNKAVSASNNAADAINDAAKAIKDAANAVSKAGSVENALNALPEWSKEASIIDALNSATTIVKGFIKTSMIDVDNLYCTSLAAVRGTVGGFEISTNWLEATSSTGDLRLSAGTVAFYGKGAYSKCHAYMGSAAVSASSGSAAAAWLKNAMNSSGYSSNGQVLLLECGNSSYSNVPQNWINCHQAEGWGAELVVGARYFGDANQMNRTCIQAYRIPAKNHVEMLTNSPKYYNLIWEESTGMICIEN